jgi:hypothetical protein
MPGWDGCLSRKTATSDKSACVISHNAARFSATGVQSTDFSRVFVPLRKAQLKLVL